MSTKKFNSRIAATALAMATMASALAIPANAADYGTSPNYSEPTYEDVLGTGIVGGGSGSGGSSSENPLSVGANAGGNGSGIGTPSTPTPVEIVGTPSVTADRSSVLTDKAVSEALGDAAESGDVIAYIDMKEDKSGNVTLREDTLAAIASGEVALSLNVKAKSSKDMDYAVTVIPGMIKKVNGSVNLAMKVRKVKKISSVRGVKIPSGSVVLTPKAKADIGMAVAVTLPKDAIDGLKQSKLGLFAIDADGNCVQLTDDYILIGADGSVTIAMEDASVTYVISDMNVAAAAERHAQG